MSRENHNKLLALRIICLLGVCLVIGLFCWLLTYKSETKTSTTLHETDALALECTSTNSENAFFVSKTAQRFEHKLKLVFRGESLRQMSYDFTGTYNSERVASDAEASMHADYNKYMASKNIGTGTLNPNFNAVKSKVRLSLYLDLEKNLEGVGPIFYLTDDEYLKIKDYKMDDFKKIYKEKGFSCSESE